MPRSVNPTQAADLPPAPGSYLLLLDLDTPARLTVGRLGTFDFPAGRYAYAGSARGPGGLRARVSRHLRNEKRLHWHIDYLAARAPIVEVWYVESGERLECLWPARLSALPGASLPVDGFGSSDCRCRSHLIRLPDEVGEGALREALPKQWQDWIG
jgi:Uri superfamily endonuclease